ncbi:hypothetical protein VB716_08600 [Synechococcus sp. CCY9201]|uniref:variant leucine-rich repeat-containing protein n=1 Tax=Synechococcus sp. CCY9201 TaxID=174697 RepID=UPI002B1FB643|nr:hypothetical protein [Synechococcus sp. CCY9201]MEA5474279.1 hypothetical protein [Synechococcus sp. CCY9201]
MPKPIENALIEASNPETKPERLQQLSQRKHRHERYQLRQAIASNPNCDEELLLELAAEHPRKVVYNPRFQLLLLSDEVFWEDCRLSSLLMLLAELGAHAPRQMRRAFFDLLGPELISTDPLFMNQEWHMAFSKEITIKWTPSASDRCGDKDSEEGDQDDDEVDEDDRTQDAWEDDPDTVESQQQDFSVEFSCVVEENLFFLNPPNSLDDPISCLKDLIAVNSSEELPFVLEMHGWEAEFDSCPGGQGYWQIESVTPELDDWEVEAELLGDGSGTVHITDPSGETHDFEIEAPDEYGDEYLNPTLNDSPDFIASIFDGTSYSPAELRDLLLKVIAVEK